MEGPEREVTDQMARDTMTKLGLVAALDLGALWTEVLLTLC